MAAGGRTPTLQLGALTGVWAAVYQLRDRLEAETLDQVLAAWRPLAADLDLTAVMTTLSQQVDLGEAVPDPAADRRRHLTQITAAAVLAQLARLTNRPGWPQLIAALTAGMRRSRTAGTRAAAAVANDTGQLGDGGDLDGEGSDDGDANTAAAYTVTASALRGTAQAIARALLAAALVGDGLEVMQTTVDTVLADATAWTTAATTAAAAAFTDGLTAAYQARGVEQVDYVTAGDGRVCPACAAAEDGNPYPAATVPQPPLHPNCRCIVRPA